MAASDVATAGIATMTGGVGTATDKAPGSSGVRLAVAILFFWMAGLCFFIAFGSGIGAFKDLSWKSGGGSGLANLRKGLGALFQKAGTDTSSIEGGGGGPNG